VLKNIQAIESLLNHEHRIDLLHSPGELVCINFVVKVLRLFDDATVVLSTSTSSVGGLTIFIFCNIIDKLKVILNKRLSSSSSSPSVSASSSASVSSSSSSSSSSASSVSASVSFSISSASSSSAVFSAVPSQAFDDHDDAVNGYVSALIENLNYYKQKYIETSLTVKQMLLDPRVKHLTKNMVSRENFDKASSQLRSEILLAPLPSTSLTSWSSPASSSASISSSSAVSESTSTTSPSALMHSTSIDDDDMDLSLDISQAMPPMSLVTDAEREYINFQEHIPFPNVFVNKNLPHDILQWYRACGANVFPRVAYLARKYLCMYASSVVTESTFSVAGHILTPSKLSSNPDNVEELMMVHVNRDLLDSPPPPPPPPPARKNKRKTKREDE
jgi:hypothetical protein